MPTPDPRIAAMGGMSEPVDAEIASVKMKLQQVGQEQDKEIVKSSPRGKFTKAALSRFVSMLNSALSIFGAPSVPEPTADLTEFDPDLASATLMVCSAINDAVKEAVLDPELAIDPAMIVTDADLRTVIAQIGTAIKDKVFKRWLTESPTGKDVAEDSAEGEGPSSEEESGGESEDKGMGSKGAPPDIMKLFASRA